VTLNPTNDTVVHGNASVIDTSRPTLFVKSAKGKAGLPLLRKSITSFPYRRAEETRRATSCLFVNPATPESLLKAVTGGGGQISKTFFSGQRRGALRKKTQFQRGE